MPLVFERLPEGEMQRRARAAYARLNRRRTVRHFAPDPIPEGVVEDAVRAAGTAPSGAHQQPWHFAVVRSDTLKARIREAAEAEERAFYAGRAPQAWLDALARLGTDAEKPFLTVAPCLIAVFVQPFGLSPTGERVKHYYATESVGIATGLLLSTLHEAGLATLTHTPSPMGFLGRLLGRPEHERAFVLVATGFPAEAARVPILDRLALEEIASFH